MATTMDDVRTYLDAEEVDYQAASLLGAAALPHLEALVRGDDAMLAAKAAYLASLIPGDLQPAVLATAAASDEVTVRVAAASAMANVAAPVAESVADDLLADADFGVRRQAVRAAARLASPALVESLRRVATDDPSQALRDTATEALRDL